MAIRKSDFQTVLPVGAFTERRLLHSLVGAGLLECPHPNLTSARPLEMPSTQNKTPLKQ